MPEKKLEKKSEKLKNKKLALCICGSIAAVESVKLARELRRHGASVKPFLTKNACSIISAHAIEYACNSKPTLELSGEAEHLEKFDLILIAPATANIISKLTHGIADDAVTTLCLANRADKILIAPAMHESMFESEILRENIKKLKKLGYDFVEPEKEEHAAKLASIEKIVDFAIRKLSKNELADKKVTITAGATYENIDPIRIITNLSSGKTGIALAKEAFYRGAEVRLIHGLLRIDKSIRSLEYLNPIYAPKVKDMLKIIKAEQSDIFISAAAISDFVPEKEEKEKIKSGREISLKLKPAGKVIGHAKARIKAAFKAEHNIEKNKLINEARKLITQGNADIVFANDIAKSPMAGDYIQGYIVTKNAVKEVKKCRKEKFAEIFINEILKLI